MFVIPAKGLVVRRPERPHPALPLDGAEVSDYDVYWHRRLRDGDVTLREEKTEEAAPEHEAAVEHQTAAAAPTEEQHP